MVTVAAKSTVVKKLKKISENVRKFFENVREISVCTNKEKTFLKNVKKLPRPVRNQQTEDNLP